MSEASDGLAEARAAYEAGDLETARKAAEGVLARDKSDSAAKCLLGALQISLGKLPAGFANYEARWELPAFSEWRRQRVPWWDGSPLGSRTLLLGMEQGPEEVLQFCRYAPVFLRRFPQANVVLEVPREAHELIQRSFSRVERLQVVASPGPSGEGLPDADLYLPLVSAPNRAQTTLTNVPAAKAYLYAKQPKRLATEKELAIGIAWRSTHPEEGKRRSIPLAKLARTLQHPGTRIVNLQDGETEAECRHLTRTEGIALMNPKGVPPGTAYGPWSDVVAGCDLIVSIDNTAAHLAAALGKETWVLLSKPAHWRWASERDDSPWYPGVRLFRQSEPGDWELMLPDLLDALRERLLARDAA